MEKNNTYFCDIDGTIFKYRKFETYKTSAPEVIPTTLEFLEVVKEQGHMIILTTARPEDLREHTIKELDDSKVPYDRLLMGIEREHTIKELKKSYIPYDRLIMGIERGPRYLINDMDPNKPGKRAIAMNLIRNEGI